MSDDGLPGGVVKPSNWNDEHDIDGYLGAIAVLALAPSSFAYVDGAGAAQLGLLTAVGRAILAGATAADVLGYLAGAPLASAALTGAPTAPTPPASDNSTRIATMAALQTAIANLVDSSPAALNTLNELATALGNDPSFSATITAALGNRLRFDAAQTLTAPQRAQAASNLGLPTFGTAASYNVGTAANQVVQLDGSARLPAVDGSQLTNVTPGTGALRYDQVQTLTNDQRSVASANLGDVRFTGVIVESRSAGAVTFAVKTLAGNDPSAAVPVVFRFPNATGGFALMSVTAALSITVPSGATLGAQNGTAFRVWLGAFNDAGTVRLFVRTNMLWSVASISAPPESFTASSTLTPGNSAQVNYTTGAAVTSKYWSWLAFATYESGLATAGTWNVAPDALSLVTLNTPRPGDKIQEVRGAAGSSFTAAVFPVAAASLSITPQSKAHVVRVSSALLGLYLRSTIVTIASFQFYRGASGLGVPMQGFATPISGAGNELITSGALSVIDAPLSVASVTYTLNTGMQSAGSGGVNYNWSDITLHELMV